MVLGGNVVNFELRWRFGFHSGGREINELAGLKVKD